MSFCRGTWESALTYKYYCDMILISKRGGVRDAGKNTEREKERTGDAVSDFTGVCGGDRNFRGRLCNGRGRDADASGGGDDRHRRALDGSWLASSVRTEGARASGSSCADTFWKLCGNAEGRRILLCKSFLYGGQSGGEDQAEPERRRE